ncbi:MAG: 4-hydroxy-3-methylbut-2-enyl diphosphate reductase [Deltaproteobacteria bacterium]|nr:4-hydroxy-3-methylbut-2-enyl diphosphate reductase [Deltaproteobacteria bacterium]
MEHLKEIWLATPRGFCAGVDRAIAIVERALEKFGAPVYVKHAIVHNRHVVERLEGLGAVFVEDLANVPAGAQLVFSAHGVSPAVRAEAQAKDLRVLDATCPLVTKVHMEARKFDREERTILLIGHRNHVEVQGTLGEAPHRTLVVETLADADTVSIPDPERVAVLTQTTLSVDDTAPILARLKQRFPALQTPRKDDICYATQNRQGAVKNLAGKTQRVLVVGSAHSSNSNRLVEVARSVGVDAHLVESWRELNPAWLAGVERLGITAGASAPEQVVAELVAHLAKTSGAAVHILEGIREDVEFPLPAELAK